MVKLRLGPSVKSVLKRAMQLISYPLATMFPKDGVGLILVFILGQAGAQQTTNFANIDCCAVKKVEGKKMT